MNSVESFRLPELTFLERETRSFSLFDSIRSKMLSLANMYDDWGPVIRYLEKKGGCEDRAVFMYWKRHSVRLPSDAAVRLCSAPSPWIRLYWLETYGEAGEEYATRNIRPLQEDVTQMLDRIEKLKTQWQRGHERSV